ncbi:uncharacterized protein LOC111905126 [Lactuca sativa]|uniref:Transmembrane protein n=1 Tax=Lactuca sativa TaxID=4236 RepID=A0A9R1V4I4_LACSA|nr:uncharacterized protein LOC111905126 [Lactuca sativa]KAJ0198402.1 hypothetical protein LSAT_V11C700356770 [Lactuca sativa]
MEGFQKAIRSGITNTTQPSATNLPSSSYNTGTSSYSASPSDPSAVLFIRPPRRAVSVLTCSKLCAVCFAAGIIVGFTLKRRVRRWAARLLRRIKDD